MSIQRVTTAFVRSDGTQWVFFSGLVLGLSANLLIWALAPEPPPTNVVRLGVAGGFLAIASGCFSSVGWILQRFEYVARTEDSPLLRSDVKSRLVAAALGRLLIISLLGLLLSVTGLGVLLLQRM